MGVPLFFCLSGFILCLPFGREVLLKDREISLKSFYLRRLTRLEPPYLIALTVFLLVHLFVLGKSSSEMLPHYVASFFYVHSFVYGEWSQILPVAWTLEIEVQFYLLAPFIARFYFRRKLVPRRLFLALLISGLSLLSPILVENLAPYHLHRSLATSAHYFLSGLLLADLFITRREFFQVSGARWDLVFALALLASSASDVGGGFKEATAEVTGADAYGALKFESGVHRVQRVPATETQGRVHTSTASVAVLPRAEEVDVEISDKDVRVDTMRASGAGGQHVNTTCSAVRVTHLETGIVVVIQDERSQHKNREKAMRVLRSRVYDAALRKSRAERSEKRRSLVGSGDRSERVRTYNYKEGRVKDHRVNVLSNDLAGIMEGGEALAEMMDALREEEKRRALEELMETTE